MTNEVQRKLEDLRYLVQQLGEQLQHVTSLTFNNSNQALFEVNNAIDQWNMVINRAPQALKAAKLELQTEVDGAKNTILDVAARFPDRQK